MTEPAKRSRRATVQTAVLVVLLVYAVLFIVFNAHHVKVSFVFFSTRTSLIFSILLALAVGFVLGRIGPRLYRNRKR